MDVIVLRVSERQTFEAENRHLARKVGKLEAGDHGRSRPIGLTRSTRVLHELKNFPDEFSLGGSLLAPFSRRWPVSQRHCRDVSVNRLVPQRKRGARFDLTQRAPRGIVALQACALFHRAPIRPKGRPRGRFHQAVAWVVPHPLDGDVEVLSIATPRGRAIAPCSRATVKARAIGAGIRATRRHR